MVLVLWILTACQSSSVDLVCLCVLSLYIIPCLTHDQRLVDATPSVAGLPVLSQDTVFLNDSGCMLY